MRQNKGLEQDDFSTSSTGSKYSITGENQGPRGSSSYVESRPVRINSPIKHELTDWVHKVKMNPPGKTFQ